MELAEGGADGSGGLERFSDARSFCEIYLCAQTNSGISNGNRNWC